MGAKKKKKEAIEIQEPSEEEIKAARQEMIDERKKLEDEGYALAKEAWKTETPTYEMVSGAAQILAQGTPAEMAGPLLIEAISFSVEIGVLPSSANENVKFALGVFDALVDDEDAKAHLLECKDLVAKRYPNEPTDRILDRYFDVYGEDEGGAFNDLEMPEMPEMPDLS